MDKAAFIRRVRQIGPTYFSNNAAKEQLAHVELLAIVGPTGAGKTTITDKLGLPIVKSDVTREQRPDERHSDTYIFRSDYQQMETEIESGEYVQFVVSASDEFYGTRIVSYPQSGVCTMPVAAGAIPSFKLLGFKKLTIVYIMPPGYIEWMKRIGQLRASDLSKRMDEAMVSLRTAITDPDYRFILNDEIDMAVSDIHKVLKGEELSSRRAELARETADLLLERLGDQSGDLYFN